MPNRLIREGWLDSEPIGDDCELAPGGGVRLKRWHFVYRSNRTRIRVTVRRNILSAEKCALCPATAGLSIDHIWPWAQGGTHHPLNLRALCRSCNSRKGARHAE